MSTLASILWVDDEIESLKSQILFLKNKNYQVSEASNGHDALEWLKENQADVILLDESMPGITGLETLARIKESNANQPVVMITKNETEYIMEEAIGSQIADYLIKPVNPNQVLLAIKKITDGKRLVSEKTTTAYQQEFRNLFMALSSGQDYNQWKDLYQKLIYWELEMDKSGGNEMQEVLETQFSEANTEFFKFIQKNYLNWIQGKTDAPMLSHQVLKEKVFPYLQKGKPTFLIVIDNLRLDQWKVFAPKILEHYRLEEEDTFYSILPTATQYARNALFAGITPLEISKKYPDLWRNDDEDGGKNLSENVFLEKHLQAVGLGDLKWQYVKVTNNEAGKALEDNIHNYLNNDLTAIVYNFVDMLSHARTEMEVLKELAGDVRAYRSLALSWFEHSPLFGALKKIADKDINVIITTDHGTVQVRTPSKCIGDRHTTANLRYKLGRNLQFEERNVLAVKDPKQAALPSPNVSSSYIFAKEDVYLCYPNNYNHFVNYYRNTFQHGGVSLEEMIVPIIRLSSKK